MLIIVLQCRCFLFCLGFLCVSCPAAVWVFSTASSPSPLLCSSLLQYLCQKSLSAALSAAGKPLWKHLKILPWLIWVAALWMSWITYACHMTGLCCLLLILGYRFCQKQTKFFCGLCSSIIFGATGLLGSRYSLSSWLLWPGFFLQRVYIQLVTNILCPFFHIFKFSIKPLTCPRTGGFFCLSTGRKESLL